MRTLYLDCFSGISGDMLMGALISAGADFEHIKKELKKIHLHGYELKAEPKWDKGIGGINFDVLISEHEHEHHHHIGYNNIAKLIDESQLSQIVKKNAKKVFYNLASAEAKVHGSTIDEVHFHEVGAVDSIIDIVGGCIALDYLNVNRIFCSPINLGGGKVKCAHGVLPVPAPATAELIKGVASYGDEAAYGELTTPTGAAFIMTMAKSLSAMPNIKISSIGYGFGNKQFDNKLNALRAFIGECSAMHMLSCNLDDMTGESLAFACEEIRKAGAVEAYLLDAHMKKGRAGFILNVLCNIDDKDKFSELIFLHTSTLGIRIEQIERETLERQSDKVKTPYGEINIKKAFYKGRLLRCKAEYEDCAMAARAHGIAMCKVKTNAENQADVRDV